MKQMPEKDLVRWSQWKFWNVVTECTGLEQTKKELKGQPANQGSPKIPIKPMCVCDVFTTTTRKRNEEQEAYERICFNCFFILLFLNVHLSHK